MQRGFLPFSTQLTESEFSCTYSYKYEVFRRHNTNYTALTKQREVVQGGKSHGLFHGTNSVMLDRDKLINVLVVEC